MKHLIDTCLEFLSSDLRDLTAEEGGRERKRERQNERERENDKSDKESTRATETEDEITWR